MNADKPKTARAKRRVEQAAASSEAARDVAISHTLREVFGLDTLRPLQRQAIDAALDERDALVVMPTGGGKSLCYQLPPLVQGSLTIVVSPLIALMQDQVDGLRLLGVPAAALHSNLEPEERTQVYDRLSDGSLRLLFVAPERLVLDGFAERLSRSRVGALAVDEAHCISQWGHDFRPEYRRLHELRARLGGVACHAFTATATARVREDIVVQLGLRDPEVLVGTFDRPNLVYRVQPRTDRTAQIVTAIKRHPGAAAIVYCLSRKDTETVAGELSRAGLDAAAYHAGLDARTRTRISERFRREALDIVVATVAFGMGIDRSDVRLVVHAALPKSVEHYQQETGRAGRDGLPAECLLLYSGADAVKWSSIITRSGAEAGLDDGSISEQLALVEELRRLVQGARCRHRALSEYFGQHYPLEDCGACDVCLGELAAVPDATTIAQKILSCVARCDQRFGARHIADVLRGARTQRVEQLGHDRLSTFGLLAEWPANAMANFIDQLVDAGDLARSSGEYPVLVLTPTSLEIMRGQRHARLVRAEVETGRGRRSSRTAASRGGRSDEAQSATDEALDDADEALFQALRALRRQLADEAGVPPYLVFSDATLTEIARERPHDLDAFATIRGVGPAKLARFGPAFVEAVRRSPS